MMVFPSYITLLHTRSCIFLTVVDPRRPHLKTHNKTTLKLSGVHFRFKCTLPDSIYHHKTDLMHSNICFKNTISMFTFEKYTNMVRVFKIEICHRGTNILFPDCTKRIK